MTEQAQKNEPTSTALVIRQKEAAVAKSFGLEPAQYIALRDSIAKDATPAEFQAHLMIAKALRLSPVGGQVHFVKRWDSKARKEVFQTQVGIDGYLSIAQDTNLYDGPVKGYPQFQYTKGGEWTTEIYDDQVPYAAKHAIWRKGWRDPVEAVAIYSQYVQTVAEKDEEGGKTGGRRPNAIWKVRPHPQLAKCALALACRLAFPRELLGVVTAEEMSGNVGDEPVQQRDPEAAAEAGTTLDDPIKRKALVILGGGLPAPGPSVQGPTKWPKGKYRQEMIRLGSFDAVFSELVAAHQASPICRPEFKDAAVCKHVAEAVRTLDEQTAETIDAQARVVDDTHGKSAAPDSPGSPAAQASGSATATAQPSKPVQETLV